MTQYLPRAHPHLPLSLHDITGPLAHLLPSSATSLVAELGPRAALALLNRYPGVVIPNVPKTPDSNAHGAVRWASLSETMGDAAMQRLAKLRGGETLAVPNCHVLRTARFHGYLRERFDTLTAPAPAGPGLSKNRAIEALVMEYAPITCRAIEMILDKAEATPAAQNALF
jgi:hypothetical protein